ncbi:MAG: DNA mismatch repair endonuclease MutL [Fusobacterium sp. JB021]|nr:DNA mismatch repair endonuclease MutL [Fusobacterium sp. JB020]MDP0493230.1 DNA mismatch repair endonuclease MutL [Fusobacterium sp. JB021]MDP0506256.1 DNA mismatch repair endonuclease MutL [Fusobacterium sp. JB019]
MGLIKILDEKVSNMIAAGEVVENPASMIKELLENSIDAKSTEIIISVKNNNRSVKISDNGKGMSKEDLLLSIERHATSKIYTKEDLSNILTYGFRGEALSSISSVSKIRITTKTIESEQGSVLNALGGKITNIKDISREVGTEIEIKDLFFNTPARLKFLRKTTTEFRAIKEAVILEALANPNISITLINNDVQILKTSGRGMKNTILEIFGRNTLQNIIPFPLGYLGNMSLNRSNKDGIYVFINNRPIKSKIIEEALIDGYYTKLMKGRYPFAILFIEIDPKEIDINVHPSKKIVKFSDEKYIYNLVYENVKNKLLGDVDFIAPTITPENGKKFLNIQDFKKEIIKTEPIKLETNKRNFNYDFNIEEKNKVDLDYENKATNKIFDSSKEKIKNDEIFSKNYFSNNEKTDKLERVSNVKNDYKIIGQFANSFIILERNNVLEIYDQHIIHERILYEKFKNDYKNKSISIQQLLVPVKFSVSAKDKETIENHLELLRDFGFEVDFFGKIDIIIRAVPNIKFLCSIEELFRNIIEDLKNTNLRNSLIEDTIIMSSCKNAIKANQPLNNTEIKILLDQLFLLDEYTCPHGRPILMKLTLNDIEKLFNRK